MFWTLTSPRGGLARGLFRFVLVGALVGGLLMLAVRPAHAQTVEGDWRGALQIGPRSLRLEVSLTRAADGTLSGHMLSLDQTPAPLPLADITAADGKLAFAVPMVQGHFNASWDEAKGGWSGVWLQGSPLPLVLTPGKYPPPARPQEP